MPTYLHLENGTFQTFRMYYSFFYIHHFHTAAKGFLSISTDLVFSACWLLLRALRVIAELFAIKSSTTQLGEHYCGGPDHEDTLNGGSGIHVARSGAGKKQ